MQSVVRSEVVLNVPALHSLQSVSEEAPVLLLHFPGVQNVADDTENWAIALFHFPAGSMAHCALEERPVVPLYRPTLHALGHLCCSSIEVKGAIVLLQRPAGHLEA